MKFDIFSRKKFNCNLCDEKFKTQLELTEHKPETRGNKVRIVRAVDGA